MISGLESIALAVAHLEQMNASTDPETSEVLEANKQMSGGPPEVNSATNGLQTLIDNASSTSSARRLLPIPTGVPFNQNTPRLVSNDSVSTDDVVPQTGSPVFSASHHSTPYHPHHTPVLTLPHHNPYKHHIHQRAPLIHYDKKSPNHVFHQELLYHSMIPTHPHGPPSYAMMQASLSHPQLSHPTGSQHHTVKQMHEPHHKSPVSPENAERQLARPPTGQTQPSQQLLASHLPSPTSPLPAAVLAVTDSLEEFFTIELDHSIYPPIPKPSEVIVQVQRNDVLLGRGGETNHHVGNIQYRQLVKLCQPAYLEAKRRDKPKIAERIVHAVRCLSGRFLKKDPESSTWRDVGNTRAREKTSQALREGAPELRNGAPCVAQETILSPNPKRSLSQMTVGPHVAHEDCMIGSVTPKQFKNMDHCEVNTDSSYHGFGLYASSNTDTVMMVDTSPQASPMKKQRLVNSQTEPTNPPQRQREVPLMQLSTVSVSPTVSGDDDESFSTTSFARRTSDDEHCGQQETCTGTNVAKAALPRLKLLKKRLAQCD